MPMFEVSTVDLRDASGIVRIAVGQSLEEGTFILRLTYVPIGFEGPDHSTVFLMKFDHMAEIAAGIFQTVAMVGKEEEFMEVLKAYATPDEDDVIVIDLGE